MRSFAWHRDAAFVRELIPRGRAWQRTPALAEPSRPARQARCGAAGRSWALVAADLALWRGRPAEALGMVKAALASFKPSDMAFLITQTLVVGMRACADLADNARARRDEPAVSAALSAAGDLASWADGQAVPPLADHPFLAQIPADRATWDAERTRLAGTSDPVTWSTAPGPGKTSAGLTPLGTPGGGPPKHSSAPASPDPRPRHCAPPPQQPPVTNLSSARSAHSPSAPGFPCPPPAPCPAPSRYLTSARLTG